MANNAPTSFGTGFATVGFSFDPNLSPNNQTFGNAVLAVVTRNATAIVAAGGGGGSGGGGITGISGTATGAGTAAVTISGVPINGTGGTFTLTINTFAGTNPGVVPSSAGGTLNFLRADGAFATPGGTYIGLAGTATGPGTAAVAITNASAQGGTFTLLITTFAGTAPGVVPSSAGGTLNFLRADGAYAAPPGNGLGTLSGPTNLVALTSTVGTSTAGMRSDSAPALSTAIAPTWIGQHTFNGPNPGGAQIILGTSTSYAWGTGTNYPIIQLAGVGAIAGTATGGVLLIGGGLYSNGTSYVYGQAGTAAVLSLQNGTALIQLSTAGTAGQTAAPSNQLVVTAGGVQVPGTASFQGQTTVTGTASFNSGLTSSGTATFSGPLTVTGTLEIETAAVLGTGTYYSWGGGTGFTPALQVSQGAGITPVLGGGFNMVVGMWYNGTNYLFTGTGGGGTSTGAVLQVVGPGLNVFSAGVGTYTQAAALKQVFAINGTLAPTITGYGPIAATLVDMTPDKGTFTATLGAVTAAITPVCFWARSGNLVVLAIGTGTGTSNANTFTLAGLPAAITPARIQRVEVPDFAIENSGAVGSITTDAEMVVPTNGTMTFLNGGTATGWGATLFKGISSVFTVSYLLN